MKSNKILIMLVSTGVVLLFTGCTGNVPKPLHQQQRVVKNIGNNYYYVPAQSYGFKVDKKVAYMNNVITGGLLQCRENDVVVETLKSSKDGKKLLKEYFSTLTAAELKVARSNSLTIPKKEGKEFQKFIATGTKAARSGEIYCINPMSNKDVKQYKAYQAQQAKINNDPRVVAARIQAQSAANVSNAQISAANNRATWDNINRQSAQMNYNTQQMLNRSNTYNVNVRHY